MTNLNVLLAKPSRGHARGVLPVAPDGYPFIIGSGVIALVCLSTGWHILAAFFGVLFLFVFNFFRDFEQDTPQEEVKFMNAYFEKTCDENERNKFTLETEVGDKVVAEKTILALRKV